MTSRAQHARAVLGETLASTRAARTPSLVTLLVVAAVTITGMFTAGRSAAAERTLAERVDAAGARIITISDGTGVAGLTDSALIRSTQLTAIDWVIGLGIVTNVWPAGIGPEGTPVAGRPVTGDRPTAINIIAGRWPAPGEAVATTTGIRALGFATGTGTITDGTTTYPIVGVITLTTPALDIASDVLYRVPADNSPLPQLIAMAHDTSHVSALGAALTQISGATQPNALRVNTSADLLALHQLLGADFSGYSRAMAALVILAGTILIALTLHGAMTARRRDFGRRRALGASRSTLIAMIIGHTAIPALLGTILGTTTGHILVRTTTGSTVPVTYTLALATLVLLAATIAALPAAITTARRDPVRELRIP